MLPSANHVGRRRVFSTWDWAARFIPRRLGDVNFAAIWPWLCGLLAIGPVGFLAVEIATWIRNIPNWDEFDTVLDFLIALDSGMRGREFLQLLFAVTNEHRILASRLVFATSYWLFGDVNFAVLAVVGNLFLVAAFGVLLLSVRSVASRLRLAGIFALVVFQLQQHENLFWAGSSIDHFFVVLAVVAALGALSVRARWSLPAGAGAAFLATFSLAHGLLVWPLGVVLLARQRRWRACAAWAGAAAVSAGVFFAGFHINAGHDLPGLADLPRVIVYWLTLLGSSAALDNVVIAPWLGAALVLVTLLLLRRGGQPRERFALAVVAWCLGATAMIAWGRTLLSSPWAPVTSRYMILSSMAWALLGWILVERGLERFPRLHWGLAPVLAGLVTFNVAANTAHLAEGHVAAENAEKAAFSFQHDGSFARAEIPPYPDPARADALVRDAGRRGLFRLPAPETLALTEMTVVPVREAQEIGDAVYFIEDVEAGPTMVRVRGWAFRADETARLNDLSVVFRDATHIFAVEASPRLRPDVAVEYERADAIYSGFELRLPRDKLPPGEFGIGVCFDLDDSPEYMMTANTIVNPNPLARAGVTARRETATP